MRRGIPVSDEGAMSTVDWIAAGFVLALGVLAVSLVVGVIWREIAR